MSNPTDEVGGLTFTERLMRKIGTAIEQQFHLPDEATFEVLVRRGPSIYVRIPGAEGDLTLLRQIRAELTKIIEPVLRAETGEFDFQILAFGKQDALLVEIEVIFPLPAA